MSCLCSPSCAILDNHIIDHGLPYDYHLSSGTCHTALQRIGFDKRHAKVTPLAFARAAGEAQYCKMILPAMVDYYETDNIIVLWTEFGRDADFSPYVAPVIIALDACIAHSGGVKCIAIEDS